MSRATTASRDETGGRRPARLLSLLAVTVALFAAVASTDENEPRQVEEGARSAGTDGDTDRGTDPSAEPRQFAVGDLVELGDWRVRVHDVTDPVEPTDEFLQPAAGHRWVAVDAEVTNTTDRPATVSSIMCFEIVDDRNQAYTQTITGQTGPATLDGEVPAGGSRRGILEYEVPADASGLRLNFSCDLFAPGTATIALSG